MSEVTNLRVNVFFPSGIMDIAPWCFGEFELTEAYHSSNYSHIKNSGKLTVSDPDAEILPYFLQYSDNLIPVHIYVKDEFIFNGYIRMTYTATLNDNVEDFTLEVIDRSRELERKLDQILSFEDYKICDTADPDNSILHQLLYISDLGVPVAFGTTAGEAFGTEDDEAFGFYTANYDYLFDIDITIDYYFRSHLSDERPKIYDLIQELLAEAGYILRLDLLGNPRIASIIPRGESAESHVFQDSKVFKGFQISSKQIDTDSVRGTYHDHELLNQEVVFNEETDGDSLYDCRIDVPGTGDPESNVYPEDADLSTATTKLNFEVQNKELIVAKFENSFFDLRPLTFFEPAKTWEESVWLGTSVDNGAKNTSAIERTLIRMQVVADAIVQGDSHEYTAKVEGLEIEHQEDMPFKILYHPTVVEAVVDGWLDNYVYGRYDYKFVAETEFDLGGYYEFSEDVLTNVVYKMKIIKKIPVWRWSVRLGYAIHFYRYEAISYGRVVSIDTVNRRGHITKGRSNPRIFRDSTFAAENPVVTNPEPPYKVGDMWIRDDGNYRCIAGRSVGESYDSEDWEMIEEDNEYTTLQNIFSDGKLTPLEKTIISREWSEIQNEYSILTAQATSFGLTHAGYTTVYESLETYIGTLNLGTEDTEDIDRIDFDTYFVEYYDEKETLVRAVETRAKELADLAQDDADDALDTLDAIASDGKLTPVEKHAVYKEWLTVQNEYTNLYNEATSLGISTADYTTAYDALDTYIDTLDLLVEDTEDIDRTTFNTKFENYYNERDILRGQIGTSSKNLAFVLNSPSSGQAIVCGKYANGEVHTDMDGKIDYGGTILTIDYQTITAITNKKSYLIYDSGDTPTITPAYYDFDTNTYIDESSNTISDGCIIGWVERETGDILESYVLHEAISIAEAKAQQLVNALKYLSEATDGSDFGTRAENLGIDNAFSKLAVYQGFFKSLFATNITAGDGDGTGSDGLRFRVHTQDVDGDDLATPIWDVMWGSKTVFRIDATSGNVYFGDYGNNKGFYYDASTDQIRSYNDNFLIDTDGTLKAVDGEFSGDVEVGGLKTNDVYVIYQASHLSLSTFDSPDDHLYGMTFDGTHLISSDSGSHKIYIHDGVSGSILTSFNSPADYPGGLTFDGTHLISANSTTNKIYIHDGITGTVLSSFSSPGDYPMDLAFDGTNLISIELAEEKIYVHDGVSNAILFSFNTPASSPRGLTYDGANLISTDVITKKIYIHDGISADVLTSFGLSHGNPSYALAFDGVHLITNKHGISPSITVHRSYLLI